MKVFATKLMNTQPEIELNLSNVTSKDHLSLNRNDVKPSIISEILTNKDMHKKKKNKSRIRPLLQSNGQIR